MINLRASSMPLAFACPASVRAPSVVIRESSEPAGVGSAVHEALRPLVELGTVDWSAVDGIADSYGVPVDDVRALVSMAAKAWEHIASHFPTARTETFWRISRDSYVLSGHTDVGSIHGGVARILDWKTGRKDHDYSEQMRAYCALALSCSDVTEATATIVWVRDGEIENYTMDLDGAASWEDRLVRHVVNWDGAYYPGEHCAFCPRSQAGECDAIIAMVRRAAAPFANGESTPSDLSQWSDEQILDAYSTTATVLRYAKMLDSAIREHTKRNGPVRHNGCELVAVEEQRQAIDAIEAWETFMNIGLDNEDLRKVLRVSNTELSNVVRAKAGRGKKASAVQAMRDELDRVGAVRTSTIQKVVSRRSKES